MQHSQTSGRFLEVSLYWRQHHPGRHYLVHAEHITLCVASHGRWQEVVEEEGWLLHLKLHTIQGHILFLQPHLSACLPSMAYSPAPENYLPPSPYQNMVYSPSLLLCQRCHIHNNHSDAWWRVLLVWQGEGKIATMRKLKPGQSIYCKYWSVTADGET